MGDEELKNLLKYAITLIISAYNEVVRDEYSTEILENFKFDSFHVNRYCWCGEEGCESCEEPNFYFKPYDLSVSWYKHVGRSMDIDYEEQEITPTMIITMITDCVSEIVLTTLSKDETTSIEEPAFNYKDIDNPRR